QPDHSGRCNPSVSLTWFRQRFDFNEIASLFYLCVNRHFFLVLETLLGSVGKLTVELACRLSAAWPLDSNIARAGICADHLCLVPDGNAHFDTRGFQTSHICGFLLQSNLRFIFHLTISHRCFGTKAKPIKGMIEG